MNIKMIVTITNLSEPRGTGLTHSLTTLFFLISISKTSHFISHHLDFNTEWEMKSSQSQTF